MTTISDNKLKYLIDRALSVNLPFAIFRYPNEDRVHIVAQRSPEVAAFRSLAEVKNRGFVVAPFRPSAQNPTIIINNDINDFDELNELLNNNELHETLKYFQHKICDADKAQYQAIFAEVKRHIISNEVSKVVLARSTTKALQHSVSELFINLLNTCSDRMVCLVNTHVTGVWMCATPELLLRGTNGRYATMALAGTRPSLADAPWDAKNLDEHEWVCHHFDDKLRQFADVERHARTTFDLGTLQHLRTDYSFSAPATYAPKQIAAMLHPTPAVCGWPTEKAMEIIDKQEVTSRLYYSGVIGQLDEGACNLYVNLRCAHVHDGEITTFAGGGIMPDSEVETEWHETEMKMLFS